MDNVPTEQLRFLGFHDLAENWQSIMKKAIRYKPSYQKFLSELIETEYEYKIEKTRLARIKRAKIPEVLVMETFPFDKQPRLKKKLVFHLYDSLTFMREHQDLIFIGPTGCGKTGLATAFLVHALNQGFRGLFVDFKDLLNTLHQSQGDYTESRLMKRFAAYDVLLIDELGYIAGKKEQLPLFFDLMRRRHKGWTTIITTQLGFDEWGEFLRDPHLAAALLDRITVNCAVFNMKDCISIRPKKIVYATSKRQSSLPDSSTKENEPPIRRS